MIKSEQTSLVQDYLAYRCKDSTIEARASVEGLPKLYDTLSAFANQDEGGIIIFGVADRPKRELVGVADADDLLLQLDECCAQMEPKVQANSSLLELAGKTLVIAKIPPVAKEYRPVHYKGSGVIRGSFVRIGDGNALMTPLEIHSYESFRSGKRDELRVIEDADLDFFDNDSLAKFILAAKAGVGNPKADFTDPEILQAMGVCRHGKPTMAATMVFSRYPQGIFPQLSIVAELIPGTRKAAVSQYDDSFAIAGHIPYMLEEAQRFVRRYSRSAVSFDSLGNRTDKSEYPMVAIREAILNALMHRDYSIYSESIPITIEMYSDRIEIRNPGMVHDCKSLAELVSAAPQGRNPIMAQLLELLGLARNRCSGLTTMIAEMEKAGLPEPEIVNEQGFFTIIFRNASIVERHDNSNLRASILRFCKTPKSRADLLKFTGLSRYYLMSKYIQPMLEEGLLVCSLPDKPKSSNQRYMAR